MNGGFIKESEIPVAVRSLCLILPYPDLAGEGCGEGERGWGCRKVFEEEKD